MHPGIFNLIKNDPQVIDNFGSNPVRVFPFGEADQSTPTPYAAFYTISGNPVDSLNDIPKLDDWNVQFSVYGETAKEVLDAGKALVTCLQNTGYIIFRGDGRDPETKRYRYIFEVSFFKKR